MDIKLEFLAGMTLQLSGLVLLAFYFGRRLSPDRKIPARISLLAGLLLALSGTGLQIVAASQ